MNHTAFIAASYGASLLVLGALALVIIAGRIKAKRELAELDAAGIKRRSDS
ncbi:MAG: heme exporter protein CcmD [Rhizobiaceae bacterium]